MSDANDAVGVNVFVGKKPLDNDAELESELPVCKFKF